MGAATSDTMDAHATEVVWTFVVPPSNSHRVQITQRKDGPFHDDKVGGDGYYYVSKEWHDSQTNLWRHVVGSASGGHASWAVAHRVATEVWNRAVRMEAQEA